MLDGSWLKCLGPKKASGRSVLAPRRVLSGKMSPIVSQISLDVPPLLVQCGALLCRWQSVLLNISFARERRAPSLILHFWRVFAFSSGFQPARNEPLDRPIGAEARPRSAALEPNKSEHIRGVCGGMTRRWPMQTAFIFWGLQRHFGASLSATNFALPSVHAFPLRLASSHGRSDGVHEPGLRHDARYGGHP